MKWALIGVGHIGTAILEGWIKTGHPAKDVYVSEISRDKEDSLQKQYGVSILLDASQLSECELVLFAVKPQDLPRIAANYSPYILSTTLVVSIAAGIDLASLRQMLVKATTSADEYPILRVLPNLPSKVGAGISVMVANKHVSQGQLEQATDIFQNLGLVMELPEENFAAVTALSGSGPAFVAVFIEALADAAVYAGLHSEDANLLATQTLLGTAKLLLESKTPPAILKNQVCTAAGTSIYGIRALEKSGFRASVFDAVIAASERTEALAREATDKII
ncbi:MAG: pyrroline-5-carboxylate reductase [Fastidiosipila sp.]|nr:pyrroline-5-carboxylate reductase [Fastidiosipila sp.]